MPPRRRLSPRAPRGRSPRAGIPLGSPLSPHSAGRSVGSTVHTGSSPGSPLSSRSHVAPLVRPKCRLAARRQLRKAPPPSLDRLDSGGMEREGSGRLQRKSTAPLGSALAVPPTPRSEVGMGTDLFDFVDSPTAAVILPERWQCKLKAAAQIADEHLDETVRCDTEAAAVIKSPPPISTPVEFRSPATDIANIKTAGMTDTRTEYTVPLAVIGALQLQFSPDFFRSVSSRIKAIPKEPQEDMLALELPQRSTHGSVDSNTTGQSPVLPSLLADQCPEYTSPRAPRNESPPLPSPPLPTAPQTTPVSEHQTPTSAPWKLWASPPLSVQPLPERLKRLSDAPRGLSSSRVTGSSRRASSGSMPVPSPAAQRASAALASYESELAATMAMQAAAPLLSHRPAPAPPAFPFGAVGRAGYKASRRTASPAPRHAGRGALRSRTPGGQSPTVCPRVSPRTARRSSSAEAPHPLRSPCSGARAHAARRSCSADPPQGPLRSPCSGARAHAATRSCSADPPRGPLRSPCSGARAHAATRSSPANAAPGPPVNTSPHTSRRSSPHHRAPSRSQSTGGEPAARHRSGSGRSSGSSLLWKFSHQAQSSSVDRSEGASPSDSVELGQLSHGPSPPRKVGGSPVPLLKKGPQHKATKGKSSHDSKRRGS
eukprot:Hpha_TRINITY_DN8225_c0_g1::TRINITY_DN8225_c0_g1_i1::g.111819::m.111819